MKILLKSFNLGNVSKYKTSYLTGHFTFRNDSWKSMSADSPIDYALPGPGCHFALFVCQNSSLRVSLEKICIICIRKKINLSYAFYLQGKYTNAKGTLFKKRGSGPESHHCETTG